MKKIGKLSLVQLNKDELKELFVEVKETLATGIQLSSAASETRSSQFGLADLWNLQRRMKTASGIWNRKPRNLFIR